jgi:hypothetical protein
MTKHAITATTLLAVILAGCQSTPQLDEKKTVPTKADRDLRITLGGFVENHPEGGTLNGVCGTDNTRNVLNCDIHNGLLNWTVTEVTIGLTWIPYGDDDKSYFREVVSIEPLKTGQVSNPARDAIATRHVSKIQEQSASRIATLVLATC